MRVIMLDDVDRVGHEGDIITVADGYARNYLMPKGLAVKASKGAEKDLERRRRAIEVRDGQKRDKAQVLAEDLGTKPIVVMARAGEGERLHGQVTTQMISQAAKEQLNIDIDRRDIDIAEPIRQLGDYLVSVKLYKSVAAQLAVGVVRDAASEEEAAERDAVSQAFEEVDQESEEEAAEREAVTQAFEEVDQESEEATDEARQEQSEDLPDTAATDESEQESQEEVDEGTEQ